MLKLFFFRAKSWFYIRLTNAPKNEDPEKKIAESFRMMPREELDVFLSYRGATGRYYLWMTLLARINVMPTVWTQLVVFPILSLVEEKNQILSEGFPSLIFEKKLSKPSKSYQIYWLYLNFFVLGSVFFVSRADLLFWQGLFRVYVIQPPGWHAISFR